MDRLLVAALKEYGVDKMKNPLVTEALSLMAQVMSKSFPVRVHTVTTLVQEYLFPHLQSQGSQIRIYTPFATRVEGGTLVLNMKVLKPASVLQRGSSEWGLWTSRIGITGNLLERQKLGPQFRPLNQPLWDVIPSSIL